MITSTSEMAFWNQAQTVGYFASKEPDPRVMKKIDSFGSTTRNISLDLGCGGGRHTQALGEANFLTLAIDVNPAMLAYTASRTRHLTDKVLLSYGSISDIPSPNETFDLIVSTGVLHQAKSAEAMNLAISEVARVAKKGAIFIGNLFVSDIWDETYTIPDSARPEFVETKEHLGMTLVDADRAIGMFVHNGFAFEVDPTIDFKQENTGPRGVFRFSVELTR